MSWDIYVQDLPLEFERLADIPTGFRPGTLGERSRIIASICEVLPMADFSDPSWGVVDGDGWSIEVNLGKDDVCRGFAFHVRGGGEAVGAVAAVLKHLNLRALDAQTGEFFSAGAEAQASFARWRAFRDRVVDKHGGGTMPTSPTKAP
jgi:hypothetical protein